MIRGVSVVIVVAALAGPSAAAATETQTMTTSASGGLHVSWYADPARGCAADGLCGITGSASAGLLTGGTETSSSSASGWPVGNVSGLGASPTVDVIRVYGGAAGACVDQPSVPDGEGLQIQIVRGGARIGQPPPSDPLGSDGGLLGTSRCAGPLPSDIAGLIPWVFVSEARLRRGSTVPLTVDRAFVAGAFRGTLISTLRVSLRITERRESSNGPVIREPTVSTHPSARRAELAMVRRSFVITDTVGGLTASFAGTPTAECAVLDACGVTGTSTLAGVQGTFELTGSGDLPTSGRPSASAALTLFANGRLPTELDTGAATTATVSEVAARPGSAACRDSTTVPLQLNGFTGTPPAAPGATAPSPAGAPGAATMSILIPAAIPDADDGPDLLRTRCAGPSEDDLFASAADATPVSDAGPALAGASVPVAALIAGGPVALSFTSAVSSAGGIYAVSESGPMTVTLVPTGPAQVVLRRELAP